MPMATPKNQGRNLGADKGKPKENPSTCLYPCGLVITEEYLESRNPELHQGGLGLSNNLSMYMKDPSNPVWQAPKVQSII